MKFFSLFLIFFCTCFSIYIEKQENFQLHKELSRQKDFEAIGIVESSIPGYGSGALIHPRIVITAAHCIKSSKKASFSVRLNNRSYKVNGRAILHPKFDILYSLESNFAGMMNDIGFIILDNPLPVTNVPKLKFSEFKKEEMFYNVGFGLWSDSLPLNKRHRRLAGQTNLNFIGKKYLRTMSSNETGLELYAKCGKGDSGSPLLKIDDDIELAGILIGTLKYKHQDKEHVCDMYININYHKKWIEKTLKEVLGDYDA